MFNEPSFAINNPNLLPEEKTPVIDLAKTLSPNQKNSLEAVSYTHLTLPTKA